MKSHFLIVASCLLTLAALTLAFPGDGWKAKLGELRERAAAPINSVEDSDELLGDLISPGPMSPVGKSVADIITGKTDGQSTDTNYATPGQLGSPQCMDDACCVWKYAADEMAAKFKGDSGRCNLYARGAIRLGFHDAGTWKKGMQTGGADGSMILSDELLRPINRGLEEIVDQMRTWYQKYQPYGAGAADLIQMGATVATVVCPLGPRIRSFVGRQDSDQLPPEGLLPDVNATVDSLIQLFEDKTIRPHGLAALVGAHTTSQQRFFQPTKAFDPQDSTPGVWDVLFYGQTLNNQAPQRVVKFTSDITLSTHPRVRDEWQAFTDPKTGQEHWNDDFAKEYVRLSMLGVRNVNQLTECTKVLPPLTWRTFVPPDRSQVDQWLTGGFSNYGTTFGQLLDGGRPVTPGSLTSNGINPADANNREPPRPDSPYNRPPPVPAPVRNPPPRPAAPSRAPPKPSSPDSTSNSRSSSQTTSGQPNRATTTSARDSSSTVNTSSTFTTTSSSTISLTQTSTTSRSRGPPAFSSSSTLSQSLTSSTPLSFPKPPKTTSNTIISTLAPTLSGTRSTTNPNPLQPQTSGINSGRPGLGSGPRGGQDPSTSSRTSDSSRSRLPPTTIPVGSPPKVSTSIITKSTPFTTPIPRQTASQPQEPFLPGGSNPSHPNPTQNSQSAREPKGTSLSNPKPVQPPSQPKPASQPQHSPARPSPRPQNQPKQQPKPKGSGP